MITLFLKGCEQNSFRDRLLDSIDGDVSDTVNKHEMLGPENVEWGILIFDSQELESFAISFLGEELKLWVYHAPLGTSHVSDPSVTREDRRASRRECSHTNKGTGEVGKLISPLLQLLLLSLTHRLDEAWVCLWSSWHPAYYCLFSLWFFCPQGKPSYCLDQ